MSDIREAIHKAAKEQLSGLFNSETAEKIAAGIAKSAEEPVLESIIVMLRTGKKTAKKKQTKGTAAASGKGAPPAAAETPKPTAGSEPSNGKDEKSAPASGGDAGGDALGLI